MLKSIFFKFPNDSDDEHSQWLSEDNSKAVDYLILNAFRFHRWALMSVTYAIGNKSNIKGSFFLTNTG